MLLISSFLVAHIDIWCNEDGCDTAGYVAKELEKIFHSDHIFKHDAATLTQPSGCKKIVYHFLPIQIFRILVYYPEEYLMMSMISTLIVRCAAEL